MMPDFLPVLSAGAHRDPSEGACVMEYVSFLAGEPFTDRPTATATATAAAVSWYANDTWLHSLLVGALDVFDRLEGRTAEDLTPERLQQLCALTRS